MAGSPFADLPSGLRDRAFEAGNGEIFWPRSAVVEVVEWLRAHGTAVIGGELYRSWTGGAWASYIGGWETAPGPADGESWPDFVRRAAGFALQQIESDTEDPERRIYFLAVTGAASDCAPASPPE